MRVPRPPGCGAGRPPGLWLAELTPPPQSLRLRQLLELPQGVVLDLADALARHAEGATHLLQRERLVPPQPIAQLDHLPLPLRQRIERLLNVLPLQMLRRRLERLRRRIVSEEVTQLRLVLIPD